MEPRHLKLVEAEIAIMQKLKPHPRIIKFEEDITFKECDSCCKRNTKICIVMELIEGQDLRAYIKERKKAAKKFPNHQIISEDEVLRMAS